MCLCMVATEPLPEVLATNISEQNEFSAVFVPRQLLSEASPP